MNSLVAALGQFVVLHLPEDCLDIVELGAIGRQVVQVDALGPQLGQGGLDESVTVQGAVVQRHHSEHRKRRQGVEEAEEFLGYQALRLGDPVQSRSRSRLVEGGQEVEAAPLGVLVGNALTLPLPNPTVGDRLGGAEAALVRVGQD